MKIKIKVVLSPFVGGEVHSLLHLPFLELCIEDPAGKHFLEMKDVKLNVCSEKDVLLNGLHDTAKRDIVVSVVGDERYRVSDYIKRNYGIDVYTYGYSDTPDPDTYVIITGHPVMVVNYLMNNSDKLKELKHGGMVSFYAYRLLFSKDVKPRIVSVLSYYRSLILLSPQRLYQI